MSDEDGLPRGWHWSSGGNPQIIYRGMRITVFERDGGWKFCIAVDDDDDDEPHFSDAYETQDAAMYEAFALMDGEESLFRPLREIRRAAREERERKFWREAVADAEVMASQLKDALPRAIADSRANITKLMPVLRKLESKQRWIERAIEYYDDVGDEIGTTKALRLRDQFLIFITMTKEKIAAVREARSRKTTPR